MKKRNVLLFGAGLVLGLLIGYLLSNRLRSSAKLDDAAGASADQVLAKIDFESTLARVGEGQWKLVPIPNDGVKENRSTISTPKTEASVSTTRCYAVRCDLPELTVDQEQSFFNKLTNFLRDEIGKHGVTTSGGSIGMVPLFAEKPGRFYCTTIHFHTTPEHPNPDSRGGLRGSATVWLTSDGKTATAPVTLTEFTRGGR